MPTEFSIDKRDIQFLLHEHLQAESLCKLPAFEEFNREVFDMVIDEAVKTATEILAPLNQLGDSQGLRYQDGEVKMPDGWKEAFKKFGEGGWIGMVQNPEYGGQGLPHLLRCAGAEMFSGANISLYLSCILTEGAAHLVEVFGSEELKKLYCEKMYTGQWSGTMCLTEPSAGSDVGALKTSAKKNGDNYLISGSKIFISAGEHDIVPNIIHLVLARIEGAPAGTKGISLFVVPKFLVNEDGSIGERNDMICGNIEHKMGIKASPTCTLNFGDEGKCQGWLLGEENTGMRQMFQMMNEARLGVGVQGLGLATAGYQSALGYAQERVQGAPMTGVKVKDGVKPAIIEHPDVRRMLMNMKSMVEGIRTMMYSVAHYLDLSHNDPDPEERKRYANLVALLTPVCKAYGTDMGFWVNDTAVQVYGGYGYCQEYPVEQYLRDQKISAIYEGTNGIQAMDLLGRKVTLHDGIMVKQFLQMLEEFVSEHKDHDQLGALVSKLDKAKNTLVKVTMTLVKEMGQDLPKAFLHACPYLLMFGHVTVSYFLLQSALVAQAKLKEMGLEQAEQQAQALADDNSEAAFYHGRIGSARHFIHNTLPQVSALAEAVLTEDRTALEVSFPK